MKNRIINILLFTVVFLLLFQLFGGKKEATGPREDIVLTLPSKMVIGNEVVLTAENNSPFPAAFLSSCPKNPLLVEFYENGEWQIKEAETDAAKCVGMESGELEPGKSQKISFAPWNAKLFDKTGVYRITFNTLLDGKEKTYSKEITITAPGVMRRFFREIFYRPIVNTLVFLVSVLPRNDLGFGIILLTIIIKVILLGPNQKALKSQKAIQKVQPELDALKIKYKNDPQALAQETMGIWKKYKVNPLNSCLPILLQFPILIALFYVVKDDLGMMSTEMFYAPLRNFDLSTINTNFLGILDLTKINFIVLPIIIGAMQFIQMRLALPKNKGEGQGKDQMALMNKMMQYAMPIMIAFFTASLPAAVGFYWGTSTLFGIGQQVVVNRMKD
ncbi:YidC/Oxa1 family membrane protein insertase [Candidatus Peregrinibacteria bacterium]|nr:YidC/Oxa1 family membrane protein insertase [Candidatus Peregrinibacteria bacterium]